MNKVEMFVRFMSPVNVIADKFIAAQFWENHTTISLIQFKFRVIIVIFITLYIVI